MHKIIRIAVFFIFFVILLNSLFFIVVAVYKSIHAYMLVAQGKMEERPGIHIAESLDSFMIALFFLVFAIGIKKLFLPKSDPIKGYDLPWLKMDNFAQLKYLMWEVLLTTIFVYYITRIIIIGDELEWKLLIIPFSILMLAVAFKLFKEPH